MTLKDVKRFFIIHLLMVCKPASKKKSQGVKSQLPDIAKTAGKAIIEEDRLFDELIDIVNQHAETKDNSRSYISWL